ncbi:MAG: ferrous iron transport protein A [Defluviitaleaceae bacterium]|nr:ferrous iron transport protein A [Defluviitaleaceae bacterium]
MASAVINLYEAAPDVVFSVVSVPNIGLLGSMGLRVGSRVVVQNRYALGGPVLMRVEDTYSLAIGKDIATQIAVREAAAS